MADAKDATRFIILCRKRTGSTMLSTAIDSHPDACCLGEIFRVNRPLAQRTHTLNRIRKLAGVTGWSAEQIDAWIRSEPLAFFDRVLARRRKLRALGCKLFLNHHPGFLGEIAGRHDWAIIRLTRSNILAAYSSQKIADRRGRHNLDKKDETGAAAPPKVWFDSAEFEAYRSRVLEGAVQSDRVLEHARCRVLELDYAELEAGVLPEKVAAFLGLDASQPLRPRTMKAAPRNVIDRFQNPADVRAYMEEIAATGWL